MNSRCQTGSYLFFIKAAKSRATVSALSRRGRVTLTQVGVISVLEQLLGQSKSTEYAFLCDPAVQHVSKLKKEGTVVSKIY